MAKRVNLVPETVNIEAYAGDDLSVTVRFVDGFVPDPASTYAADVKPATGDPATETFGTAVVVDGVVLTMTPAQTNALTGFSGVWDCEWTDEGGQVKTLVRGSFTCVDDVTDNV